MPRRPLTQPRQPITQPRLPITQPRRVVGFLPTDKIRVVLDTNVILNALVVRSGKAKEPSDEERACVAILEKWEAGEIAVGLNQGLKKEYEEKLEKWVKDGNVTLTDANSVKKMVQDARYVRELVDKQAPVFIKPNEKDEMLFDALSAPYLVTNDKGIKFEKMKAARAYREILKPTQFISRFNF